MPTDPKPPPIWLTISELLLWSQFTASQPGSPLGHKHLLSLSGFTLHLADFTPLIILNFDQIDQALNQPPPASLAPGQLLLLKKRHRQALRALARKHTKPKHL